MHSRPGLFFETSLFVGILAPAVLPSCKKISEVCRAPLCAIKIRYLSYSLCIFCWSPANDCFEVFDEVRLVEISEIQGHRRTIHSFVSGQAFGNFVESIALDYPLRTYTDLLTEEPLQCSFIEVEAIHYVLNPGDFLMSDDIVNDPVNFPYILILLWQPLT